jgi:hypothetical protein
MPVAWASSGYSSSGSTILLWRVISLALWILACINLINIIEGFIESQVDWLLQLLASTQPLLEEVIQEFIELHRYSIYNDSLSRKYHILVIHSAIHAMGSVEWRNNKNR